MRFELYAKLCILWHAVNLAWGHGELMSPRSRNWYAHQEGTTGSAQGLPPAEYCPHCLNTNADLYGVCGVSTNWDYNDWLDSTGNPMPWNSQEYYFRGQEITVRSFLTAHHAGHMEIKACPLTTTAPTPTQECFNMHPLTFVSDVKYGMPADPNYRERGYYAGGQGNYAVNDFEMIFKLPDNVFGPTVLLQWRYITANSCSPPGYAEYFGRNDDLDPTFWSPAVPICEPPYPADGTRSGVWPEQFWNCAEVTISESFKDTQPCCSENWKDCDIPFVVDKASCESQGFKWMEGGALLGCEPRFDVCSGSGDCCDGLVCAANQDDSGQECQVPTGPAPNTSSTQTTTTATTTASVASTSTPLSTQSTTASTSSTSSATTSSSTSSTTLPASTGDGCCSQNYKDCVNWCGETRESCQACGSTYVWLDGAPPDSCLEDWADCTHNQNSCCPGLVCQYRSIWWSQCAPPSA